MQRSKHTLRHLLYCTPLFFFFLIPDHLFLSGSQENLLKSLLSLIVYHKVVANQTLNSQNNANKFALQSKMLLSYHVLMSMWSYFPTVQQTVTAPRDVPLLLQTGTAPWPGAKTDKQTCLHAHTHTWANSHISRSKRLFKHNHSNPTGLTQTGTLNILNINLLRLVTLQFTNTAEILK